MTFIEFIHTISPRTSQRIVHLHYKEQSSKAVWGNI